MAISGDLFSGLGSAVGDIFGGAAQFKLASGYKGAAESYLSAAGTYGEQAGIYEEMGALSGENAKIAQTSSTLGLIQKEREINKVLGGQQADFGGAGLKLSGSALDVIKGSLVQGQLELAVGRQQGALDQQGYKQEALSYAAMGKASEAAAKAAVGQASMASAQASAAKTSGGGGILGGILKVAGVVAPFLSDVRAKQDVTFLDDDRGDGIAHYLFRYRDAPEWYIGVLAQEVAQVYPDAVTTGEDGYFRVNYGMIGDAMYHVGAA